MTNFIPLTRKAIVFLDICRYLGHGDGTNHKAMLAEAMNLLPCQPAGAATLRSILISGEISLLDKIVDTHGTKAMEGRNNFAKASFWRSFEGFQLCDSIVLRAFSLFKLQGTPADQPTRQVPALLRMAILQDQPGLLCGLMDIFPIDRPTAQHLLLDGANLLNTGAGCAPIVLEILRAQQFEAHLWQNFYLRAMSRQHWKSAALALKLNLVSHPAAASRPDVEAGKAGRARLPYMVGSAHRTVQIFALLPAPEKILAMSPESFGRMLDAKLSTPS